jgi:hypothetical protein
MEVSSGAFQIIAVVVSMLCSAMGTILWFLFQSVRHDVQAARTEAESAKDELAKFKLQAAEHYVTRNDLTSTVTDLKRSIERLIESVDRSSQETRDAFNKIHERIDRKADK